MAAKKSEGYTEGAEFNFIGSLLGLMLALTGLAVGNMVRERSLDYWMEDIVPLVLLFIMLKGLFKSGFALVTDSMFFEEQKRMLKTALADQQQFASELPDTMPVISKPKKKQEFTEEEVLEAVSKRIEEKRKEAAKR